MTDAPFRLGLLVLENCLFSSLAGPADMLNVASILADIRSPGAPRRFESLLFGARGSGHTRCASGLEVSHAKTFPRNFHVDAVLVPGIEHHSAAEAMHACDNLRPEIDLLRRLHARGTNIAATCSGTLLLASTGLLDGHRATTSWWLADTMRRKFPAVILDERELLVEDGPFATTGASTAVYSLVSRYIARVSGDELAQQTAGMMLLDNERQSQAPYMRRALMERPRHSLAEKVDRFLERELHRQISVSHLADHCGTSERSLLRHFRTHYGVGPLARIQHLRVERAKALLEVTQLSFEEIVERCGYKDAPSFRKLFKRETSLTPAGYRDKFCLRPR